MDNSMENTEEVKLQWIKGDKFGNVEIVNGTEDQWTTFESGGRIATTLISEFLEPVIGDALDFNPPTLALTEAAKAYKEKVPPQKAITSPVRILFDKQKKNDKVKLNLSFPIDVPNKAIYEIISSSFGADEVNDELESFIKDQVSEDLILDSLFDSIKELIKTRYKID
jgi:hypothetical protein